jgi:succinate dehydrogenase subunit C
MNGDPIYTPYHPRWLRPRMSTYWWLGRWSYFTFILRELSSIFVAWFVLYLLFLVRAVGQGADAYGQFLDWSRTPLILLLNVITVLFLVFHAITWFNLAPKAMVLRLGDRRLPDALISGMNYAAWVVLSAAVAWLLLRA